MNSVFEKVVAGERFFLRNLVIYPLTYSGDSGASLMLSLDEAIKNRTLELKDIYDVNSIGISNNGGMSVLLLEGESLQGARQDRIVNVTTIMEPETETVLPVSCVEQGRWTGDGEFSSSVTLAFPSLRSVLRNSVSTSLKKENRWKSDQNAIWDEVRETLKLTRTKSMTLSMHDAFNTLKDEIDRYLEERGTLENVQGYMVFLEDQFVSLDLFSSYELLKKYERKLFESYAMQGILFRFGKRDLKKVDISSDNLRVLDSLKYETFKGVGSNIELRYSGELLAEISFDKEENFVYASVLPAHV